MNYRRILELNEETSSWMPPSTAQGLRANSSAGQRLHERGLPMSFDEDRPQETEKLGESESEPEDAIHSFRRVHIRPERAMDRVRRSTVNKHRHLTVRSGGLDIGLVYDNLGPAELDGLVALADKHFDCKFFYYEVTVLCCTHSNGNRGYVTLYFIMSDTSTNKPCLASL